MPLANIAQSFVQSPEFIQHNGTGLTNTAFVTAMYHNMFGRDPDIGGLQSWTNALDQGMSRGQLALTFANSPEGLHDSPNTGDPVAAFIYRMYETALNRAPDADGATAWGAVMRNGASKLDIAQDFVTSDEFKHVYGALGAQDLVNALYTNALGRVADGNGLSTWTQSAVLFGTANLVAQFTDSDEMRIRMARSPAAAQASGTHDGWVFIPG